MKNANEVQPIVAGREKRRDGLGRWLGETSDELAHKFPVKSQIRVRLGAIEDTISVAGYGGNSREWAKGLTLSIIMSVWDGFAIITSTTTSTNIVKQTATDTPDSR